MTKSIAVVCSPGIGDGLIMHIASHSLAQAGFQVTTFNDHLSGFGKWLKGYSLAKQPSQEAIEETFQHFDAIILQHDNTPKSKKIKTLKPKIFGFYGSHLVSKHGELTAHDYVCDPTKSMVLNLSLAMTKWFGLPSTENGLLPPSGLIHKKHPRRIAIHPGSSASTKNWPLEKFLQVSTFLKKQSYEPVFLSQEERPIFPSLEELASFLYESGAFLGNDSGPGHLASYLNIPSLIIGSSSKHLQLWRPGWFPPIIATPPRIASYFKWTRPHWKSFITTKKVIKQLKTNILYK